MANSADDKLTILFWFFSENRLKHFKQIVSLGILGDNLYELSKLISVKKRKYFKMFKIIFPSILSVEWFGRNNFDSEMKSVNTRTIIYSKYSDCIHARTNSAEYDVCSGSLLHCLPLIHKFCNTHPQAVKYIYRIWSNNRTVHLGFSKLLGKLFVKYVSTYTKGTHKKKDQWGA